MQLDYFLVSLNKYLNLWGKKKKHLMKQKTVFIKQSFIKSGIYIFCFTYFYFPCEIWCFPY